ncbi:MAG: hypothetical protein QOI64_2478 [Solirubrobacteraceae bacterium]|nr:hypothetical protein [Solirubrobacteraceae bacterium]
MREVPLPPPELPPLQRSVGAGLAAILELDLADVPLPPAGHPRPWTVWRNWLAGRGLGLVPVHAPANFNWPGPWLALLRADQAGGQVAAVAFGSPPGLVWNPLGGNLTFADVQAGFVIAPVDVVAPAAGPSPSPAGSERRCGRVELLALTATAEAPMTVVAQATARAARGLVGDRYHDARGTFSDPHANGNDLTLIEAEVLNALAVPTGPIAPERARRNIVTRGIDLNALVGALFTVGSVQCVGRRLCEPCAHLQRLTVPGTLRALVHQGGLRADVLTDGVIRVGDDVRAPPSGRPPGRP